MQVKDIMTSAPACCTPGTSLFDVARLMAQHDCGAVPVVEGTSMHPIGIVTDRDVTVRTLAVGRDPAHLTARDCMSSPCVTVADDCAIEDCLDAMEANQIRRIVVVDRCGRCIGLIAQADIAREVVEGQTAELLRELSLPAAALQVTF